MKFTWKFWVCVIPVLLSLAVIGRAFYRYEQGRGGFKFGVDLSGGTILIYEVDPNRPKQQDYKPEDMAARLKRRIDPVGQYEVTVRPSGADRFEIILPTGGRHQAAAEQRAWDELMKKVEEKWPAPKGESYADLRRSDSPALALRIKRFYPDESQDEINKFIRDNFTGSRQFTGEEVQGIKELIARQGSLEFRIMANPEDDGEALRAAEDFFRDKKNQKELEALAAEGRVPPPPRYGSGEVFPNGYSYSWVELGRNERKTLGLSNSFKGSQTWDAVAAARQKGEAIRLSGFLIYSREIPPARQKQLPAKDQDKRYEYFALTRNTPPGREVTGDFLTSAAPTEENLKLAVSFRFNGEGADRFYEITYKNRPTGPEGARVYRHLAIILDGQIESAPRLNQPIREQGIITGEFTKKEVDDLVRILRAGSLPATLKPLPVSENTVGSTLGEDTVKWGTISVVVAFLAVLAFMLVYYRFAGLVACAALFANLALTVAFMVLVNATFTLPGLAGLVLMLGMAVDANVLIYERLREERERGASLALALRNGYDRALPTIIDTHLTSIFTAIVLYAVGTDQLKGFGISLTVGLLISLFTSLFMTRVMFDFWQSKGLLTKLRMMRLFARPNIDFMGIRYYWFTATIVLTAFGITVFLLRGENGLNIDFTGGTVYTGMFARGQAMDLKDLREALGEQRQEQVLKVLPLTDDPATTGVRQLDDRGTAFEIRYAEEGADGSKTEVVNLPNPETPEQVREQAMSIPNLSVETMYLSGEQFQDPTGNPPLFTVRTSERNPELVQAALNRLIGDRLARIHMRYQIDPKDPRLVTLEFYNAKEPDQRAYASPNQVRMLLERSFRRNGLASEAQRFLVQPAARAGEEAGEREGRYQVMTLRLSEEVPTATLNKVLQEAQDALRSRPQPERLENFDKQLAGETQTRAMWAILLSWGAILLYLWFRFGSWTFGAAAVVCLVHDLFFTLGIIAFCHYIHEWAPGLARVLLIQDFKIDLPSVAALLTLVGYSVNDTIVVFDRIREVRGKNPLLTPQMINDSVNQTLSRTLLTSLSVWLVVFVLYVIGGEGVHLFAFVMVVGVIVGTYSSIYIASPLLLIFGEGTPRRGERPRVHVAQAGA